MIYIVTNIDNVVKEFTTDEDFIKYMDSIFEENEEYTEYEDALQKPTTAGEYMNYLELYCGNLDLNIA